MDPERRRAEDDLSVPIGAVVHDVRGQAWVFIGWGWTTTGQVACFRESAEGRYLGRGRDDNAALTETLLRRYPDARRFLVAGA